jgi:hypothetical protein
MQLLFMMFYHQGMKLISSKEWLMIEEEAE